MKNVFIDNYYPFNYCTFIWHYPESIGYFLAELLGIIFGITNSESNDDIFKKYIFNLFFTTIF